MFNTWQGILWHGIWFCSEYWSAATENLEEQRQNWTLHEVQTTPKLSTSQAFKLMLGVSNGVLGGLDGFYFGQSFSTKRSHHSLIGPEIFKAMAACSWTRGRVSAIWADQKFTKQLRSYITYVTLPRWRLHAGLQDLGIQNHFAWIRFVCRVVWSASECVDLWKIGRDTRRL